MVSMPKEDVLAEKSNERLGHLLTAIPLAHILGSVFFFWSYCQGFGNGIESYSTAADLYTVSLTDMVRVYILSLIFPTLIALPRLVQEQGYSYDRAIAKPLGPERESALKFHFKARKFIFVLLGLLNLFVVGLILKVLHDLKPFPIPLAQIIATIDASVMVMLLCERAETSKYLFETASILTSFIVTIFFVGLDKGQSDRLITFEKAYLNHTRCKSLPVLRSIGGRFIAVLPSNRKIVIDESCAIKSYMPLPGDKPKQSIQKAASKAPPPVASSTSVPKYRPQIVASTANIKHK